MRLTEEIKIREKEIESLTQQISGLKKIVEVYPDLENLKHSIMFPFILSTKSVNNIVTDYDSKSSSSSIPFYSDLIFEVLPFVNTDFGKIYSSPAGFRIGIIRGKAEEPNPNWENDLRAHNISEKVIEKIRLRFKEGEEIIKKKREDDEALIKVFLDKM